MFQDTGVSLVSQFEGLQSVMGWGVRGWVEIVEMILETCLKGALKTHIMYKSNLNSKQIAQYLEFLGTHGLVETVSGTHERRPLFQTTARGRQYIDAYRQLEGIFRI